MLDEMIVQLGLVARTVSDQQIPLEMCITSNVHTRLAETPADHPVGMLVEDGFRITLNADNRVMFATSMSSEFQTAPDDLGLTVKALGAITEATLQGGSDTGRHGGNLSPTS